MEKHLYVQYDPKIEIRREFHRLKLQNQSLTQRLLYTWFPFQENERKSGGTCEGHLGARNYEH